MREINCPQCGYRLPLQFKYTKLTKCPACGSVIFLEDEAVRLAGYQSVISEGDSLINLRKRFRVGSSSFLPVGFIKYEDERFEWIEWWILNKYGVGLWLSVDDGDYILEKETSYYFPQKRFRDFDLEMVIDGWRVTELGEGRVAGFEGELPEIVEIGETHQYIHLSKRGGEIATIEFANNQRWFYIGRWLEPFEIEVEDG